MKKELKTIGCCLLATIISCNPSQEQSAILTEKHQMENVENPTSPNVKKSKKKIKLAILLDTSGSMSGLIEQAKNQLWKIVNQLAKAKDKDGNDPEIELALYQYGNSGLSIMNGYVQKISGFTSELDEISEKLFALTINGGSEYCGTVIQSSLNELQWSSSDEDLQIIFIAGNEPFTQGLVSYKGACALANKNNVIVNTIFCGDYNVGVNTYWSDGATLGKGKYMNIDHDAKIVHIASPYDSEISKINTRLNDTYIPYGRSGQLKKAKQLKEDENSRIYGEVNSVKRIISKGSKVYKNKSWDLVDAADEEKFNINEIEESNLPDKMKGMSSDEKLEYIKKHKTDRLAIKAQIKELNKKREKYVVQIKAEKALEGEEQLDDVIISSIVEQAKRKSFTFVEDIN
ncbi:VWA domain-containing protein [Cytophagaceae bacterium AH-315-L13]|nr:VWA domain-containing protein [Cytophagaceae bacterium AH-315-L13]